jgi:hypothetical protein
MRIGRDPDNEVVVSRKISSAVLTESDIVSIGHRTFHLAKGELRQLSDSGDVTFMARDESGHPDT